MTARPRRPGCRIGPSNPSGIFLSSRGQQGKSVLPAAVAALLARRARGRRRAVPEKLPRRRPTPRTSRRFCSRTAPPAIVRARSRRCRSSPGTTCGRMRRRFAMRSATATCRRGTPRHRRDVSQRARVDGRRAADAARVGEQRGAEGRPKDLPKPPVYPDGWAMGTPDVVFEMQESARFPARGSSSMSISTSRRTSPSRSGFRRSRSGPATARSCTTRSPSTRPSRT